MGVTTGELAGGKFQIITITIPAMNQLDENAANSLAEALNQIIDDFNAMLPGRLEIL